MTLKRAQDSNNAQQFKFVEAGDTLKGRYIKTTEETINGSPAKKHWFSTEQGIFTVLGQANMYKQLVDNDTKGCYVEVTFTGKSLKLKGGKTMKVYTVDYNLEDKFGGDTDAFGDGAEPDFDAPEESELDADEPALDEVAAARATPPKTAAKPPTTDAQRKVQELVARRKTA